MATGFHSAVIKECCCRSPRFLVRCSQKFCLCFIQLDLMLFGYFEVENRKFYKTLSVDTSRLWFMLPTRKRRKLTQMLVCFLEKLLCREVSVLLNVILTWKFLESLLNQTTLLSRMKITRFAVFPANTHVHYLFRLFHTLSVKSGAQFSPRTLHKLLTLMALKLSKHSTPKRLKAHERITSNLTTEQ